MNPLAFYAMAYAGAAATQKGVGFVVIFWLAQALPVEEYAQFGLMFALQSGVAMLAGAGIINSVIGLLSQDESSAARALLFRRANGVLFQLSTLTVIVVSIGYILVFDTGISLFIVLPAVIASGILQAYFTQQAALVRLDELHSSSLALAPGGPLAGYLGAFFSFLAFGSVESFFVGMAAASLAAALVFNWLGVGKIGISPGISQTTSIRRSLGPFILIALLTWLSGYGNTYIVELLFQSPEVAKFTFLFTVSSIMHLVATSTNQVWSPRFFRLVNKLDREEIESKNMLFYALQGAVLGASGAFILVTLPVALPAFGGNLLAYQGLELELFVLFAGYAVSVPWWHAQNYFLAFGKGSDLMIAVLASSMLGLVIWIGLMLLFGSIGIYLGFLAQMTLRSAWVMRASRSRWNLRIAWRGVAVALALLTLALGPAKYIQALS